MQTPAPASPLSFLRSTPPLRFRQLDVRDDHAVVLLAAVADSLLAHRRLNMEPSLALLEMQAALNSMVTS